MKKLKLKLSPSHLALLIVGVVAVGGSAVAYQSYNASPKVVIESVQNYNEAASLDVQPSSDGMLGALTSPDIQSNYLCVNNVCTYSIVQNFIDASTTIISIPNPFLMATTTPTDVVIFTDDAGRKYTGATTTVDLVRVEVSGAATTTVVASCGASAGYATAPSIVLSSTTLVTSTVGMVENNLTAANGAVADGGTVSKIAMSPGYPYFTCTVAPYVAAGVTNPSNTFTGKATVQFKKSR